MDHYQYTATDGETVTGTLEEIAISCLHFNGEQPNNPPFWFKPDGITPRTDYTVNEAVTWLAKCENRPTRTMWEALNPVLLRQFLDIPASQIETQQ